MSEQASAAQCAPAGEREAFEAWVKTFNSMPAALFVDDRGRYVDDWIQCRWLGWQARAAWQRAQGAVPDGYALVPVSSLVKIAAIIDPAPVRMPNGDTMVFKNPHSGPALREISAEFRAMLAAAPAHPAERQEVVYLSEEAASTLRGMVEYCLNQRVCLGMDEGFASFEPEIEHDFVKELRAFAESAAPFALLPEVQRLRVAQWTTQKPTEPGAYWIRGFRLFEPESAPALVEVADDGGELVCNLHESNSQDSLRMWSPVADFNEEFEWLGPLQALAASTGQEV